MNFLRQLFRLSLGCMPLATIYLTCVTFTEVASSAEITSIEEGELFYIANEKKAPLLLVSGSRVWNDGGQVEAGLRGTKFRYQCKDGKPAKKPMILESKERKFVRDFCPSEPAPSLNEQDKISQKVNIDAKIPRVIMPRYTLLRNNRPVLSWTGVKGAIAGKTSYNVMLYQISRGEKIDVWSRFYPVIATGKAIETLNYPDSEASLEPETAYKIVVKVCYLFKCSYSSEEEEQLESFKAYRYSPQPRQQFPVSGLSFELINPKTENAFFNPLEEVLKDFGKHSNVFAIAMSYYGHGSEILQDIGNYDKTFGVATSYYEQGLYSEAIQLLESLDKKNGLASQNPGVYWKLNCSYAKIGVYDLAIDALNRGFQAATDIRRLNIPEAQRNKNILSALSEKEQKSFSDFCPSRF